MPDLLSTARPFLAGGGAVHPLPSGGTRLTIPPTRSGYADAQLDDTQSLARRDFLWTAPLRLTIQARIDPERPAGTWGFGLWNDPFALSLGQGGAARRWPCGPRALWFFNASPPNEFGFTGGPRDGWRAMAIDAPQIHPLLLTPAALLAAALAQVPLVRRPVMRIALSLVTASEEQLPAPDSQLHEYGLVWETESATFLVDGEVVLHAPRPPQGPLGFIAWIDNQYAVATPRHGLRFGTLATDATQSLCLEQASISAPAALSGEL